MARYMTRSQSVEPQVQHDVENKLFYIDLGTSRAFITYEKIGHILQMTHTEVPKEYSGKGLGKLLAKFAFEYCVENKYQMDLQCTFLVHYLTKYAPKHYCNYVVENGSE